MKKGMILGLLLGASLMAQAEQVTIETKRSTMVLNVENGKQPQYVYFGQKLSDFDLASLQTPRNGRMDAYPAYGMNCPAEAALAMKHADGNMSTELVVTGWETSPSPSCRRGRGRGYHRDVGGDHQRRGQDGHPDAVCLLLIAHPSWQRVALPFLRFLGQRGASCRRADTAW